ncbi:axin-1 isoform X2 [Anser cygnoides]|uniref:Axin-1 n=2 Tax=Anser TaxID=8842 RepID=A0A8B9CZI4_9AVES|nr:axin-1 isoform X2 [Cygnus atratus]XP_035404836.1 axin-1 isoform X2 [Cygnus atratus]XP_040429973.1 axin-1 isoform X2 [Cygnus olor]XP_040429974.1 axin-1 isoform X2 [Cygnus olor]XP_047918578.1 axin-1 isoform X2 [Anser cygnoides]
MNIQGKGFPLDLGGSFTEDAPRPPVPGEEGELVSTDPRPVSHGFYSSKSDVVRNETSTATPRRSDLDLGYEPEGSASPTPPYLKWAESLHSLLDDQDGINLFRTFLKQEDCADLLDFWFACSGFRKLEPCVSNEEKRLKLAKAIYKKYILDNNGIVSRQIKPATKSFIKDCVVKLQIDPDMFDQAQTEIQCMIEDNTYPLFLKSDIYLEYTRTGGESPKIYSDPSSGSGTGKGLPGYLPTLNEDEEWKCDQDTEPEASRDSAPSSRLTQKLLLETATQRASSTRRYSEGREFRHGSWREPVNPYYVNTGYALAPATSANDSEQQSMSSDADTMSLTDSSVDGIPPYRLRKQHRREMQESAKANGRVPLPHIPRTYRMPKDIHVEPEKFAAELINRLEEVQKEREAEEKLEERLKRVRAEEEGEEADISSGPSVISHKMPSAQTFHHFAPRYSEMGCAGMQMRDAHEENPESILDEHVQRVMKTPGCQSPGPGRHSPKPRSPESGHLGKLSGTLGTIPPGHGKHTTKSGMKLDAANLYHHKHVYHHIHHHSVMKPKEQIEAEATQRVQNSFAWNVDSHNYATKSRNYTENLGMASVPMDSLGYSSSGAKKQLSHDMVRPLSIERPVAVHPWVSAQLRNVVQPSHPFIQDPTMPPNPAPNPLTQLEEARRRLEEEEKRAGKLPLKQRLKPQKRPGSGASQPCENIVVAYYFCGEPIPYRTLVKGRVVTLGQFKELLTKKGNYRYYFKKVSDEFDCGVVFEEVREDDTILPIFEEKIIGKVEKID